MFNLIGEDAVSFREMLPTRSYHACDLATWRAFACALQNGSFSSSLACGPFADHAETSLETVRSQPARKFGAIATSVLPILLEQREPRGQAPLPQREDVVPFNAQDTPNQTSA